MFFFRSSPLLRAHLPLPPLSIHFLTLKYSVDENEEEEVRARSSSPSFSAPSAGPLLPNMFRSLLSYSLCGHRCELVTITDFNSPQDVILQRECIVLTARVHPGETCASWIMQVLG